MSTTLTDLELMSHYTVVKLDGQLFSVYRKIWKVPTLYIENNKKNPYLYLLASTQP